VATYALEAYCGVRTLEKLDRQQQSCFPDSSSTDPAVRAAVRQALVHGAIVNQGREKDVIQNIFRSADSEPGSR
jgi:hypothetical protein